MLILVVTSMCVCMSIWKKKKTTKKRVEQSVKFEHTYEIPDGYMPPLPYRDIPLGKMVVDETSQSHPGLMISLQDNNAYSFVQTSFCVGERSDHENEADSQRRDCQTEEDLSSSLRSNPIYDDREVAIPLYSVPNSELNTDPNTKSFPERMVENPLYTSVTSS